MPIKNIYKKTQKGFTLIELLVSIGLFSVVLTVALSAILTIADSNKKARSLMSVMNNLNFAVDSMTRSFKSGDIKDITVITNNEKCFETKEIDYSSSNTRDVKYCVNNDKRLTKTVSGSTVPITSSDVEIQYAKFKLYGGGNNSQPLLVIVLEGEVKVTETIRSKFTINTSVAQRKLNI